jgi:hypothetical protein
MASRVGGRPWHQRRAARNGDQAHPGMAGHDLVGPVVPEAPSVPFRLLGLASC